MISFKPMVANGQAGPTFNNVPLGSSKTVSVAVILDMAAGEMFLQIWTDATPLDYFKTKSYDGNLKFDQNTKFYVCKSDAGKTSVGCDVSGFRVLPRGYEESFRFLMQRPGIISLFYLPSNFFLL